jgi:acyl carrier protein
MKQTLITEQTVIEEVKKGVAETLGIDKESIRPENSLMKDLNAESLDFLDITYRLEQTFGIKMARHFVLQHVETMFGEGSAIDKNAQLTDKAVELLKIRAGGDLPEEIRAGMDIDEVPALVTVQTMAGGVMDILDSLPKACTACGNAAWKAEDGIHISCGSCGAQATFDNGDDLTKAWLTKVQEENKLF